LCARRWGWCRGGGWRGARQRLRARPRGVPTISARAKTHDVMVPEGKSAQAKAADGGRSGTPGEGEQEGSMSYSTENFVRRAVVGLFRGEYAGKFLCSECLITLTHRHIQRGWRKSEIERSNGGSVYVSSTSYGHADVDLCDLPEDDTVSRCASSMTPPMCFDEEGQRRGPRRIADTGNNRLAMP